MATAFAFDHRAPIVRSEAHLPAAKRSVGLVRFIPKPKRSTKAWILFLGLIALNELRGAYVAVHIWRAVFP